MYVHKKVTREKMAGQIRALRAAGTEFSYEVYSTGRRDLTWRVGKGRRFYHAS